MRKTAYELRISAWSSDVCFPISERAACLERAADLMIEQMPRLIAFCQRAAGQALSDGIPEVREAVDFLRYYAARGRAALGPPLALPGTTGQRKATSPCVPAAFLCISRCSSPRAVLTGPGGHPPRH